MCSLCLLYEVQYSENTLIMIIIKRLIEKELNGDISMIKMYVQYLKNACKCHSLLHY